MKYKVFNVKRPDEPILWLPAFEPHQGSEASVVHYIFDSLWTRINVMTMAVWALTSVRKDAVWKPFRIILDKENILIGEDTYTWEIEND